MEYYKKYSTWILSITFFLILVWASLQYVSYKRGQWEADIRNQTLEFLIGKKSRLEKSLYSRIYYTRGVAAFVSMKPEITNYEFDRLASEFIKSDSVISTMSLAKDCKIGAIYPLKGHEAAIGLDLLAHPKRSEIVKKTIETRNAFVAGPVELVEGGSAFISYTPIFDTTKDTLGIFWGVTDIVILKEELLNEAGLLEYENDFRFAIRGIDGKGIEGEVFWGNTSVFQNSPVEISIELPNGNWVLAAVPANGWSAYYDQNKVLSTSLLFSSFIISILLFVILKGMNKIRNNANELSAIFNSMDTLVIEFSKDGDYMHVAPTNLDLLFLPKEELIGKNVVELFKPELAKLFKDTVVKCLETKEVIVIDYPLEIKKNEYWFRARVSICTQSSVLFNIYDITEIKKAEEELKESESRLIKLNELKTRFFSIVAHDLRNPIGSFRNLTELILDETIEQTEEEKIKLIRSIHNTSNSLGDLLENLLSWAQSQQDILVTDIKEQNIFEICNDVILTQEANAYEKTIELKNLINEKHRAYLDKNLTKIILRNLISNAIKFSYPKSTVIMNSEMRNENLIIHIEDEGVGISSNKIDQLFNLNKDLISYGTKNEKGSGLGLMLCREFIELQGGKITVSKNKNKGSIFTFTLPNNKSV